MAGPQPAVAATRVAVRRMLAANSIRRSQPSAEEGAVAAGPLVLVGCSGGPDSLALAAATAAEAPRLGLPAGAIVVDHRLQAGSGQVAAAAARQCRALGLDPVLIKSVQVSAGGGGPEADARQARYAAFGAAVQDTGAGALLLGHTLTDQAEQVLLGLARGSGARSLAGMPARREFNADAALLRPFLSISREQTRQACRDLGLPPWSDPHNDDPAFTRVRARHALSVLEDQLGPGIGAALARTATQLRADTEALDKLAETAYRDLGQLPWPVAELAAMPLAIRSRLWRLVTLALGSPGTDLTSEHLAALDTLVTDWHGQGPLHLPGKIRAGRRADRVWLAPQPPS